MDDKRFYHIIIGSSSFFDSQVKEIENGARSLVDLVKLHDTWMRYGYPDFNNHERTSLLIVKNHAYHAISETAHDRLGNLIEDVTTEDSEIFIHNPPKVLKKYLENQKNSGLIDLQITHEDYVLSHDSARFLGNIKEISEHIIGQEQAIQDISKTLWYLTTTVRKKPYVIMLYGNSGTGKTELVRQIAQHYFDGKYLEKHLSMYQNSNYSDYFFGDVPNRISIGYDLLERESNLIFFDEIDKCHPHFYPAFYTLFDNTIFQDMTYDVDVSGTLIVLTSNFQTLEDMKETLGLPIFYRIDKFIHFNDFTPDVINKIVCYEIKRRLADYSGRLTFKMLYDAASSQIGASGENARTIKYKIQHIIEELLFNEVTRLQIP